MAVLPCHSHVLVDHSRLDSRTKERLDYLQELRSQAEISEADLQYHEARMGYEQWEERKCPSFDVRLPCPNSERGTAAPYLRFLHVAGLTLPPIEPLTAAAGHVTWTVDRGFFGSYRAPSSPAVSSGAGKQRPSEDQQPSAAAPSFVDVALARLKAGTGQTAQQQQRLFYSSTLAELRRKLITLRVEVIKAQQIEVWYLIPRYPHVVRHVVRHWSVSMKPSDLEGVYHDVLETFCPHSSSVPAGDLRAGDSGALLIGRVPSSGEFVPLGVHVAGGTDKPDAKGNCSQFAYAASIVPSPRLRRADRARRQRQGSLQPVPRPGRQHPGGRQADGRRLRLGRGAPHRPATAHAALVPG